MSKVSEGKVGEIVKQPEQEEDDSVWESPVPVETFTQFIGAWNAREFDRALEIADDILKLDPDNKIIKQYLPVLEGHRQLAEEEDSEDGEEDGEEDEESEEDEEDSEVEDRDSIIMEGKDHK